MKFHNPGASIYIQDGKPEAEALGRVTHLGIGAHPDDLEIMAFHGIIQHFQNASQWFGGVTCTHGGRSPRSGRYAKLTNEQMQAQRKIEQEKAATIGKYGALVQLDYESEAIRGSSKADLSKDLELVLAAMNASVVYTHNPADRHETHIAVFQAALDAMRALPAERRPKQVYGCEVWRDLDWLCDEDKVTLDVTGQSELAAKILAAYESQVEGGKHYNLAVLGRRRAHATFAEPREIDQSQNIILAMDLLPLVQDTSLDPIAYVLARIERFKHDVILKFGQSPPR